MYPRPRDEGQIRSRESPYGVGTKDDTNWNRAGNALGTPPIKEREGAYQMLIVHEVAHFMNSAFVPDMPPVLDEFIAAHVQSCRLSPEEVCAASASCETPRIRSLRDLSIATYGGRAHGFRLCGYQCFADHPSQLVACLNGDGPPIKDPLMTDPK